MARISKDDAKKLDGKSTGAMIEFQIEGHNKVLEVFTTRPDTIYGVTLSISPNHQFLENLNLDIEVENSLNNVIKLKFLKRL